MKHGLSDHNCTQGTEAFTRFDTTVRELLAVPHATLARRLRAYRKRVEANPSRRGPKRKVKPSASPDPAV
jgi:hypothetical protein